MLYISSFVLFLVTIAVSSCGTGLCGLGGCAQPVFVPTSILEFDASKYNGSSFAGTGCANTTWSDISTTGADGTLVDFAAGCGAQSGWNGTGSSSDYFRLDFDGTDDKVHIPSSSTLQPTNDFTAEALFRIDSLGSSHIIAHDVPLGGSSGYFLAILTSNQFRFGALNLNATTDQTLESAIVATTGTWYHLMGMYTEDHQLRLFVNGQETANSPQAAADDVRYAGSTGITLGYRRPTDTAYLNGDLAYAALYNESLSPEQALARCQTIKLRVGSSCP